MRHYFRSEMEGLQQEEKKKRKSKLDVITIPISVLQDAFEKTITYICVILSSFYVEHLDMGYFI